jgi:hypothetical protein
MKIRKTLFAALALISATLPLQAQITEKVDTLRASRVTAEKRTREASTQTGLQRLDEKKINRGFALFNTPDIIKTLQMMPGVAAGTELMSGLYVHGGDGSDNLFLLDGTTWTGAASITQNENGSTSEAPLTVNVDGSSTWVVTADTTVSALNVANGGKVVDADGKSVTIVANGQTVVQGDSDLTVTVAGSYGTEVTTSEANDVATETIDRSGFDEEFGTQTSFSLGSSADEGTTQQASADAGSSGPEATDEATASAQGGSASVWDSIVSFFKGIFGMA